MPAKLMPVQAWNAPFVPKRPPPARMGGIDQMIREPATIVGDSGKVYGRIGENAPQEPEMMSITNPMRQQDPAMARRGSYLTGGELAALGYDPNDPRLKDPNVLARLNNATNPQQAGATLAPVQPVASSTTSAYGAGPLVSQQQAQTARQQAH